MTVSSINQLSSISLHWKDKDRNLKGVFSQVDAITPERGSEQGFKVVGSHRASPGKPNTKRVRPCTCQAMPEGRWSSLLEDFSSKQHFVYNHRTHLKLVNI